MQLKSVSSPAVVTTAAVLALVSRPGARPPSRHRRITTPAVLVFISVGNGFLRTVPVAIRRRDQRIDPHLRQSKESQQ
ncbi:hypothetical protein BJ970_005216 [Saccharopolyspora phatthalungensis]|uniref:Uncharacterized protein n=1 Tax=Saccharopolyspora phatthalungensis TaxID=664693 RepID=A0A840Q599_9PSEU|nr:hypothetical protein [Saccharopolyspora phatthalungensis]